jgi:tRNA modification GTPase
MSDIYSDTIVAISTAMAPAGIGIVRLSGPDAIKIADRVYVNPKGKKLSGQKGYTIHYGNVCENGEVIDETLAMLMLAPHSYTGEDTVEFDCHGGVLATKRILEAIVHAGARPAEPGEFSRRAFLNGRIDLTQAEAVMDIIAAKNDHALRSAQHQLKGSVSGKISDIRQKLLHETAHIEAALDDPEHMSLDGYVEDMRQVIMAQRKALERLLESADSGKFMTEGIKTVIVGKPNAGKSSLLNLLIGEEKAIVTDIAGTTRDILEEQINIKGITLRLLDTAGIRDASDVIEKIGVERAKEQVKDADLVLYVVDGSVALDDNDFEIMKMIKDRKSVVILNKNDLSTIVTSEELERATGTPVISMSAKHSEGIDELEDQIEKMFFHGGISFNDEIYITNVRHKTCIEEAIRSLGLVLQSMDDDMPEDFWSIDLMGACDSLGQITGETTSEDLVNEIFSSFCMGK